MEIPVDNPLLRSLVLANDSKLDAEGKLIGDPTETAMVQFALDQHFPLRKMRASTLVCRSCPLIQAES